MKINTRNYFFLPVVLLLMAGPACADEGLSHKQTGDGFLRRGEMRLAIQEYREAVRLSPTLSPAYFNMAIAYYSEMDLKNASLALEKVLELGPNDTEACYNLACLKLYQRDLKAAKSGFQKTCCPDGKNCFRIKSRDALDLIRGIEKLDPLMRNAFFALLQKNLPALAQS